jgi:hypothetical protein
MMTKRRISRILDPIHQILSQIVDQRDGVAFSDGVAIRVVRAQLGEYMRNIETILMRSLFIVPILADTAYFTKKNRVFSCTIQIHRVKIYTTSYSL